MPPAKQVRWSALGGEPGEKVSKDRSELYSALEKGAVARNAKVLGDKGSRRTETHLPDIENQFRRARGTKNRENSRYTSS